VCGSYCSVSYLVYCWFCGFIATSELIIWGTRMLTVARIIAKTRVMDEDTECTVERIYHFCLQPQQNNEQVNAPKTGQVSWTWRYVSIADERVCEILLSRQLIYQKSFETGSIQQDWMSTNVTSIFKKSRRNYSLSVTPVPRKIMESLIEEKMIKYYIERRTLSRNQHGDLSSPTFRNIRSLDQNIGWRL